MVLIPAAKEITLWTFYGGVLGQVFTEIIKEDFVLHCKMKLN